MSLETKQKIAKSWTGKTLSEETKAKISKSRIKFLKENPSQVPYMLNHYSNGESYPEKYWREILEKEAILFEQEKRVSIYRLDFAIGHFDLEIDGEQHYNDLRILASNKRRDEELVNQGWEVIRVRWSLFQKMTEDGKKEYVSSVIEKLRRNS